MSKQPSAPGRVSTRFQGRVGWLRDLPIWTKLGLIMIVPTLATIVVGTAALLDQVQQASNADRSRSLAVVSGDASNLVHQLQNERASAIRLLTAPNRDADGQKADFARMQDATNAANATFAQSRSTLADVPDNLRALLDRIQTQLGELPVLRDEVESVNKIPLSVAESQYRVLIADLLTIPELAAQVTGDTTLTDRMRAAAAVADAKEFLSQERIIVLEAVAYGEMPPSMRREYASAREGMEQALVGFAAVATPLQEELLNRGIVGPEVRDTLLYEGELDSLPPGADPSAVVAVDDWDLATKGYSDLMNKVEVALNAQVQQAAIELGDRVQQRVLMQTGLLLLTLLLGVLFAWLVARSMARSLRDLRQGALAVAQYGLPQAVARLRDPALSTNTSPASVALQIAEPLPVRSRDEFGQVTEAFNAVHLEAVRTAAEQAALRASVATMFVNLARRSQILVDRLIGHLDRLERGEQDPDRLSELFQLDHLATRMRRNDENLLVLAGADSTRIQREPASLMDVLRAAQSEVEHYTRIEFAVIDSDIEIAAHAVNDLVHLVAELFDNATAFSAPDTSITIEARRVGDRAVLQVEDRGIGMSPDQYAELNERLATPPMVDVAVSRMMGLVVVARLAARHGVKVELRPAPERGTVADVLLPSSVLVPRALAGRGQAPTGFPAARPSVVPPGRSAFAPPLALESGPSAAPGWPSDRGFGATPAGGMPGFDTSQPAFGGLAPGGLAGAFPPPPAPTGLPPVATPSGLGAALAGDRDAPANGGQPPAPPANGTAGRPLPPWYDLTGATDVGPADAGIPASEVNPTEPLPQRRPGVQWGDPGPDPAESAPPVPPQQAWPSVGGDARFSDAGSSAPASGAPAGFGVGVSPPAPPPAWPPVAPGAAEGSGVDAVPTLPERLSASLDMTSELPRMHEPPRGDVTGAYPSVAGETPTPPSGYADDLTMELPIFRELESAWFRAGHTGSGETTTAPGPGSSATSWSEDGSGTTVGSAKAAESATLSSGRLGGSGGAAGTGNEVSWRSIADAGWSAAQAAMDPQDGGSTETGLPRRVPMAQLVPGGVDTGAPASERRSPDAVRGLLSAYHRGVQRGRSAQGRNEPAATTDHRGTSHTSGKEQEA